MITDKKFLLKLKQLQISDAEIATRMKIPVAQIQAMWLEMCQEANAAESNGYDLAINSWTRLCHHYQLVGESLKDFVPMVSNTATTEQIRAVIAAGPPETAPERLIATFIVLLPYKPTPLAPPQPQTSPN